MLQTALQFLKIYFRANLKIQFIRKQNTMDLINILFRDRRKKRMRSCQKLCMHYSLDHNIGREKNNKSRKQKMYICTHITIPRYYI